MERLTLDDLTNMRRLMNVRLPAGPRLSTWADLEDLVRELRGDASEPQPQQVDPEDVQVLLARVASAKATKWHRPVRVADLERPVVAVGAVPDVVQQILAELGQLGRAEYGTRYLAESTPAARRDLMWQAVQAAPQAQAQTIDALLRLPVEVDLSPVEAAERRVWSAVARILARQPVNVPAELSSVRPTLSNGEDRRVWVLQLARLAEAQPDDIARRLDNLAGFLTTCR
jgi:hypothetical protein